MNMAEALKIIAESSEKLSQAYARHAGGIFLLLLEFVVMR